MFTISVCLAAFTHVILSNCDNQCCQINCEKSDQISEWQPCYGNVLICNLPRVILVFTLNYPSFLSTILINYKIEISSK